MSKELDDHAFRFFKLFAQYEYALKASGYGMAGQNGHAMADWDRFSNEVGARVMGVAATEVIEARDYLLDFPPRRQVWTENRVDWATVANTDRTPQMLFAHIRRVRNNLYHGGKFNGRWIDPERSLRLISCALLLLEALVPLDNGLAEAIRGNVSE